MARQRNTNSNGIPFGTSEKDAVWKKGKTDPQYDSNMWRKDVCGHWMKYSDYGKTDSNFGWEIDHIRPISRGGSDHISNLQPLYWENNRDKADSYPWYCK